MSDVMVLGKPYMSPVMAKSQHNATMSSGVGFKSFDNGMSSLQKSAEKIGDGTIFDLTDQNKKTLPTLSISTPAKPKS